MSNVDFQNGFLCGMATKGLTRSGNQYEPIVWNDEGIYNYFYIDFKKELTPFSIGMITQSLIIHDSVQLPITNVEAISSSIYKIFCDISGKIAGITVVNKITTFLKFIDGSLVPPFSVHFYVSGITPYFNLGYYFEKTKYENQHFTTKENIDNSFWTSIEGGAITESITFNINYTAQENVSIVLT